jgi:hypothetical protein
MVLHALALAGGALVVAAVLSAAVRTVVVPRGEHVLLSTLVFGVVRWCFRLFAKEAHSYARRDRVMARFAPTALMALPIVWALGVIAGFTPIYWALGEHNWADALLLSGSSLTTLGFRSADSEVAMFASIIEALLGLGLVALLISFLPTIYGQFSRRERTVAQLYIWAEDENGVSDPVTLISRAHQIGGLHRLDQVWDEWDTWFVELSESHRSFPSLNFFRSPDPDRSWINGAGIALDLAALYLSALDIDANPRAAMMLRSGFLSLRSLCSFFDIPFDAQPGPTDPISVTRSEVDAAVDRLAAAGVPVRGDRDTVWRDFAGWRVNYDGPLTYLADFTMAPYQPWVSDRAVRFRPSVRARAAARRHGRRGA